MKGLTDKTIEALFQFEDREISKKELMKTLDEQAKKKHELVKKKNGTIDYLKISKMYHSGEW